MTSEKAGELPPESMLVDVDALLAAYTDRTVGRPVAFGTSGHRGSSLRAHLQRGAHPGDQRRRSATIAHAQGIDGPLFLGERHPRAVGARVRDRARGAGGQRRRGAGRRATTATRRRRRSRTRSSRYNRGRTSGLAPTASCITPSHNPPEDGGFKYNPPNGGPADTDVTGWIEDGGQPICSRPISTASSVPRAGRRRRARRTTTSAPYVDDLALVDRHRRHPRRSGQARRRSAGRRERRLLGRASPSATGST